MTTVLAVVTKSHSFIAADTLAYENSHNIVGQPKVFRAAKNLFIGISGSYAVLNCLQHHLTIPRKFKGYDDSSYVHGQLYLAIRNALVKFNLLAASDGEQEIKGQILIVYEGKIYVIQQDFSLLEVQENFYSIGSGYEYTTASYKTLDLYKTELTVPAKMSEAIRITSLYCPSVNDKVTILHHRNDGQPSSSNLMI